MKYFVRFFNRTSSVNDMNVKQMDFETGVLKDPSQPPPFSMVSKLLIYHDEANSYYFTASCDSEGIFNYLE